MRSYSRELDEYEQKTEKIGELTRVIEETNGKMLRIRDQISMIEGDR